MPLTPNFGTSQTIGLANVIDLEDLSTGSDIAVTQRRVYFSRYNAAYLVPSGTTTDYVEWAYASPTKSVDILLYDQSLSITTQWLDVSDTVLYTKTILFNYAMYNNDFNYSLVYDEATGLASLNSTNWLMGRMKLYVALNDATTSVEAMSNITNAQEADDRGTYLRENKNLFY